MRRTVLWAFMIGLVAVSPVSASDGHHGHASKYAGQQERTIKSLSDDDIRELRRGGGWGMAKAAELNGVPGPLHLLELKNEIPLSAEQVAAIEMLYEEMRREAIVHGEQLIALEEELEAHFQNRTITDEVLNATLGEIADVRRELRYTHLATHLKTPEILSEAQIDRYNSLRGYGTVSRCDAVPEGHNAAMWRKHNGCD